LGISAELGIEESTLKKQVGIAATHFSGRWGWWTHLQALCPEPLNAQAKDIEES